jgi:pyrimidine 5'-nucleotidase
MKNSKKIYLLDLDYCLYDVKDVSYLVNTLEIRITDWLADKLRCSFKAAEKWKVKLYKEFGGAPQCFVKASLIENKKELINCINFIHDFKVRGVNRNIKLRQKLIKIDGDLYLFTDSYVKYAKQLLVALGISDLFSDIIDISKVGYSFKNEIATYIKIFRLLNTSPNKIIMIDDSLENLLVAKKMGIKCCIWVNHGEKKQPPNSLRFINSIMEL